METEKILDLYAAKCNEELLEKSVNDYQQLICSKEKRNQLILQAQRDRTIRNLSVVEQERNSSLEQMARQQEAVSLKRQSQIQEERTRLLSKIKKEIQQAHLKQMQEKHERQREEQIVSHVIEGEQIRQNALSYIDVER